MPAIAQEYSVEENDLFGSAPLYDHKVKLATEKPSLSKLKATRSFSGLTDVSIFISRLSNDKILNNVTSRKGQIESVSFPSRNSLLKRNFEKLNEVYNLLLFQNPKVLEIASDLIRDAILQGKKDIEVSRTSDNEILIFTERAGEFRNLLIDEDGDIEFLRIPKKRSETSNEYYPFEVNFDTFTLAAKL